MKRRLLLAPTVAAALAALAACTAPVNLDGHAFACTTHRDCGTGAFCVDHVCRLFSAQTEDVADATDDSVDTIETELPACQTTLAASETGDRARFILEDDPATGHHVLRVVFDGMEARYALPDDVTGLEPDRCCEDTCCAMLGSP